MSGYGSPSISRPMPGRVVLAAWPGPQWPLRDVSHPMAALPTAPGQARVRVRAVLLSWGMSAFKDKAELLATELVTNAVHASERPGKPSSTQEGQVGIIGLCLLADSVRLRIEVWDRAGGFPVLAEADTDAENGRGLALVDAMTEGRWGWYPSALTGTTKCVWAEICSPGHAHPRTSLMPVLSHPNPETGRKNMTTTETELSRTAVASAWPTDPPLPGSHSDATLAHADKPRTRELITPGLFSKLTGRVIDVDGYGHDTAERVIEQTLAFLVACARYPDGHLVPSQAVDAGWHAFIVHTADYAEFCQRIAGRFIHHRPGGPGEATPGQQAIGVTIAAMRDAGLSVDPDLWVPVAECSQCYQGCADDPRGA